MKKLFANYLLSNYKEVSQRDLDFYISMFHLLQRSEVFGVAVDEEAGDEDGDRADHNLHHLLAPLPRLPADEVPGSCDRRGRLRHRRRVPVNTRVRQQVFIVKVWVFTVFFETVNNTSLF